MSVPAHPEPDGTARRPWRERRSVVRRLLRRRPSPEERLEQLIDAHRRELDQQRTRFEQTIADLERRERLLSDARASVERLLRLGSRDLDAREADIARLIVELTEREERLRGEEADVTRRREEIGAVELRRLRVEQRERALDEREARVTAAEDERPHHGDAVAPTLAFVPGTSYRLVEIGERNLLVDGRVDLDGQLYEIARAGPSPLHGDRRRCVYLVRGPRTVSSPAGSS
jgi:hypothetical protein